MLRALKKGCRKNEKIEITKLTCVPAIFKTTTERHSYVSNGEIVSILTAGKCKRQFDSPNSRIEVNVRNARIAENVVEF